MPLCDCEGFVAVGDEMEVCVYVPAEVLGCFFEKGKRRGKSDCKEPSSPSIMMLSPPTASGGSSVLLARDMPAMRRTVVHTVIQCLPGRNILLCDIARVKISEYNSFLYSQEEQDSSTLCLVNVQF